MHIYDTTCRNFLSVTLRNTDKEVFSCSLFYWRMNEDVQHESGTSSVQVRMCSTGKVDLQCK